MSGFEQGMGWGCCRVVIESPSSINASKNVTAPSIVRITFPQPSSLFESFLGTNLEEKRNCVYRKVSSLLAFHCRPKLVAHTFSSKTVYNNPLMPPPFPNTNLKDSKLPPLPPFHLSPTPKTQTLTPPPHPSSPSNAPHTSSSPTRPHSSPSPSSP